LLVVLILKQVLDVPQFTNVYLDMLLINANQLLPQMQWIESYVNNQEKGKFNHWMIVDQYVQVELENAAVVKLKN
jgi:hypothetical protein